MFFCLLLGHHPRKGIVDIHTITISKSSLTHSLLLFFSSCPVYKKKSWKKGSSSWSSSVSLLDWNDCSTRNLAFFLTISGRNSIFLTLTWTFNALSIHSLAQTTLFHNTHQTKSPSLRYSWCRVVKQGSIYRINSDSVTSQLLFWAH